MLLAATSFTGTLYDSQLFIIKWLITMIIGINLNQNKTHCLHPILDLVGQKKKYMEYNEFAFLKTIY